MEIPLPGVCTAMMKKLPVKDKWHGVHHVIAKDKEIFMLVEKDYPLRKGLALIMISYRLQVKNHSQMAEDLIKKIYNIANTPWKQSIPTARREFPLAVEGVPTAREMEIPLPGVCTAMMKKLPQPTLACQLSYPHQATYLMSSFPTGRRFLSPQINEEGRSHLILPKNQKRSAMPGWGNGKRNDSEERNWGSQCFSTLNEMSQPRDALLLTPQVTIIVISSGTYWPTTSLSLIPGPNAPRGILSLFVGLVHARANEHRPQQQETMTNRVRHLATSARKRNVVLFEAFFSLLVKGARDVRGVRASCTTERGQRRIRSQSYGPTPFEGGWLTTPRTVMFDWAYTHSLTYAVPLQLTLAPGVGNKMHKAFPLPGESSHCGIRAWRETLILGEFPTITSQTYYPNSQKKIDHQYPLVAKIPVLDIGKFEQWQFRIQQYLQHEHYALWEVIEFGDSYNVPTNFDLVDSRSKDGRTITVTTDDMQKKKNDVKERITLLLSLPDEHQLRNDLDSMSLDDLYNHLKVYEAEVQKKPNSNPQDMAFISCSKNSNNEDGNTVCVTTATTPFPTGSVNVATIS
uniref:Reverse transcriptase domain, reverse transcriptase zinc-binding domain protein n=1 Tax=Tanacetum cinerariifolium TaxID=118510 RepID=A0A699ITA5_TANCI|nr:reverse transcriptase domain, reverse transcriptase zinc-binding domain protein [Tanacetum cinerariifolium]